MARRREWASPFEARLSKALKDAELLLHDAYGPWAGCPKLVRDAHLLRSMHGCPEQPPHADVSLSEMRYP